MTPSHFDLVVIGGGPAGYVAAIRASQLGMKVACVEKRKTLGGTCLNVGCIPSKALLESTEHYRYAQTKFAKHGISFDTLRFDVAQMQKRKDTLVRQLTTGISALFKKNQVTHLQAQARLLARSSENLHRILLSNDHSPETEITAERVLLATGSVEAELSQIPFDRSFIVSSTEALNFTEIPKRLIVIGAGVIGLELSSVWMRLGTHVTLIEYAERAIPMVDSEISNELTRQLKKQGVEFLMNCQAISAEITNNEVKVKLLDRTTHQEMVLHADKVLVATGRRPFTDHLGLENLDIKIDPKGRIDVDEYFQTSAPGVYAVGDLIRGPMLAHKAEEEGYAAVELMKGRSAHVHYEAIPSVIYTSPEVASVGKTEDELKSNSVPFKKGSFSYMANGRARTAEETEGFIKILSHTDTGVIMGVHIIGHKASELIAEAVTWVSLKITVEQASHISHAHPTLSEILREAVLGCIDRPIHQ